MLKISKYRATTFHKTVSLFARLQVKCCSKNRLQPPKEQRRLGQNYYHQLANKIPKKT